MSEETNDLLNNLKNMINTGNVPESIKGMLENLSTNNSNNTNNQTNSSKNHQTSQNKYTNSNNYIPHKSQAQLSSNTSNSSDTSGNNINIDFDTILKMKTIIDSMNNRDDPRANLLYSLKPYLRESRKKQLDQYVNLLNMTKIAEIMKNNNKESNNAN